MLTTVLMTWLIPAVLVITFFAVLGDLDGFFAAMAITWPIWVVFMLFIWCLAAMTFGLGAFIALIRAFFGKPTTPAMFAVWALNLLQYLMEKKATWS